MALVLSSSSQEDKNEEINQSINQGSFSNYFLFEMYKNLNFDNYFNLLF